MNVRIYLYSLAILFLMAGSVQATSLYVYSHTNKDFKLEFTPDSVLDVFQIPRPDAHAVREIYVTPTDKTNKYLYAQYTIGWVQVDASGPIKILGKKGEVFFTGTKGSMLINVPTGEIWQVDVYDA